MSQANSRPSLLRTRNGDGAVTQIELFFDLVFVFAITQLSAGLRAHHSWLGVLHALILFAAVWWVWVYTAWATNWLNPLHRPVLLLLLGLGMFGLVMSAALPLAFTTRALAFAGSYVAMQLGRGIFMLWALHGRDAGNFRNLARITAWFALSAVPWLGGALLTGNARLLTWALALALEFIAPAVMFYTPGLGRTKTSELEIEPAHLAERCAGFILIALGESVTVAGATVYALPWTAPVLAAFLAALLGIVALWWIYFDKAAERSAAAFAKARDRGRVARSAYTYVHGLLVGGIIAVAAGDGLLLDAPAGQASRAAAAMMLGGPALFLLGNGIFRKLLSPRFPPSHACGLLILAAIAIAAPGLSALALIWAVSGALAVVIILSDILFRAQRK